jgi:hypothetical protein
MRKAWRLLKVVHMFCVAHGLHNLLMKDCFPNMTSVPTLLNKIQLIIDKLRYRQDELEDEFYRSNNDSSRSLMKVINTAGDIMDADSALSSMDTDDTAESNHTTDNVETIDLSSFHGLKLNSETDRQGKKSSLLTSSKPIDSNRFHTLKKRILTRWNTILTMLRSYSLNIDGIETLMHRLTHYDLLLSDVENQVVTELVDFLSIFESTTTILSASKAYPSMNLCLLLRMVSARRLIRQSKHNAIDRK